MFFDQILGAVASQSRNVYPTLLPLNFGGLFAQSDDVRLRYVNPATTSLQGVPLVGGLNQLNLPLNGNLIQLLNQNFPPAFGLTLPSQRLNLPNAFHYTFAFEQQLSREMTVSFAYVGTGGRNLLRFTTPNLGSATNILPTRFAVVGVEPRVFGRVCIPSVNPVPTDTGGGTFLEQQRFCPGRPVSDIGAVNIFETSGRSLFDSLQVELRSRLRQSLQLQASYVFSNARDDVSEAFDLAGASSLPQNSTNLNVERGAAKAAAASGVPS